MLSEYPVFPILLSTNLSASREFYGGRLALELVSEGEERLVYRCGSETRLILSLSTVGTHDTQTQVAWRVPDIHAAVADLRGRGIRVEDYTEPDPVTTDGVADMGHSWAAWFIDPSGNVLSVIQPKG